ncbi:MAG: hypothetical protein GXP22_08220 [Gammaproteobacteria bacterium]|nr:hypothetical protein [Gammaproteobacteria bacterium]
MLIRLIIISLALVTQISWAADTPQQWLDRMSDATRNMNYIGEFIYHGDGAIQAMRIIHQANEKGEKERLISLTGEAREVIRRNHSVICVLPKEKSVMIDESQPRSPLPTVFGRQLDDLKPYYRLQILADNRMAGQMSTVLSIQSKDDYRYGYKLWLDKDTGLLLRSDILDVGGNILEQIMFTRIEVLDHIDDSYFEVNEDQNTFALHDVKHQPKFSELMPDSVWHSVNLPAGFIKTHHYRHVMPMRKDWVEHLVFSDGLASVSVYIDHPQEGQDEDEVFTGGMSMGVVNIYALLISGYPVTAVGEVPLRTVEEIVRSLVRKGD